MVFQLPTVFGRAPVPDLPFQVAQYRELEMEIRSAETHLEAKRAQLRALAAAGGAKLAAALAPPPPPEAIPYVRVRALKAYKAIFRGPHGAVEYSGGPNSVNDIPTALLGPLKGRVEVVPASTEIFGVPLADWMRTDD